MRVNSFRYVRESESFDFPYALKDMFNTKELLPRCYEVSETTIAQLKYLSTPKYNLSIQKAVEVVSLLDYFGMGTGHGNVEGVDGSSVGTIGQILSLGNLLGIGVDEAIETKWSTLSYEDKISNYKKFNTFLNMRSLDCMPEDMALMDYSFTCRNCNLHRSTPCKLNLNPKTFYIFGGKTVGINTTDKDINLTKEGSYLSYGGKSEVICRDVGHLVYKLLL